MTDNSVPPKGRKYIKLPLNPNNDSIGKPQEAHPAPINPNNELPPTTTCNFPRERHNAIF